MHNYKELHILSKIDNPYDKFKYLSKYQYNSNYKENERSVKMHKHVLNCEWCKRFVVLKGICCSVLLYIRSCFRTLTFNLGAYIYCDYIQTYLKKICCEV